MEENDLKILFQNYINGNLSSEDFLRVESIIKQGSHSHIWEEVIGNTTIEDVAPALDDITKYDMLTRILSTTTEDHSRVKYWMRYAAIFIVAIGILWGFYHLDAEESTTHTQASMVEKSNGQGRKQTFNLPDGTIVKLNSSSKLTFPEYFDKDRREVILVGEAFFEVTENKKKPFVIRSGGIITTVLGTSFNIRAFPGADKIEVAVTTGKVKVESKEGETGKEVVYLEPNKKAVYDTKSELLSATDFVMDEELAWKDGIILFKHAGEADVIAQLEEWYGVKISVEKQISKSWDLNARFENATLEHVLKVIGHQIGFEFKIDAKDVTLKYEKYMK